MERIVVGVDGSEGSLTALAWAVEEARRGDASVEVVYTWHQAWVAPTHILGDVEFFAEKAEEVLDAVIAAVDTAGVEIERKLSTGSPAQALIHESKGAALLVVGSRGRGGFTGLLLGSVGQQVAQHARCPVVIVPAAA
jgi:nucleotide-binding universal stress UspA family protein